MDLNLKGRRALVCGSTQGIGKAAAIELALLGADITLVARNAQILESTMQELSSGSGQQHNFLTADFNFPDQLKKVVTEFVKKNEVHILVNNTGGPPAGPAIDASVEEFTQAFNNHLVCNHLLVQAVVPGMKQSAYGRIINVISTSVKIPIAGLGVSNTIRGAVANWSKTLASELAPFGITVNNVLPGTTMTGRLDFILKNTAARSGKSYEQVKAEMIAQVPAGRISAPEEVAAVIAFLATPAAGYVNGTYIPVDGGRTGSL